MLKVKFDYNNTSVQALCRLVLFQQRLKVHALVEFAKTKELAQSGKTATNVLVPLATQEKHAKVVIN